MSNRRKIGLLTIGQSPRDDILAELRPLLHPGLEIIEAGALDDLSEQEISRLSAEKEDLPLVSRLANGRKVILSREKILSRLQEKIYELEKKAEIIALLCTDSFPELFSQKNLIFPYDLMKKEILRILPSFLMVFVPLKEQVFQAKQKWSLKEIDQKVKITIYSINPYELSPEKIAHVSSCLLPRLSSQPDLAIFDCLGYSLSFIQAMANILKCPCLRPRELLAQAINLACE